MSDGITGPESVILKSKTKKHVKELDSTSERYLNRKLIQDSNSLWSILETDYGFKLKSNPRKARSPACGYVLEAVRGTGRKKKTKESSQQFKLQYKSKEEAIKTENILEFGEALLTKLQLSRKRHRGTVDCGPSTRCDAGATGKRKRKKGKHADLGKRLCARAASNGVEKQMFVATHGYTDFRCVGDLTKPGAISNFITTLKRKKTQDEKRETADKMYREYAEHLRRGLQAGTVRNFVRHCDDDEEDDVASWRRERASQKPDRTDFSAYDLYRVQKQMVALAVYYEAMQTTGKKPTDKFDTQEDALIYAGKVVSVSSRTIRRWRDDFQTNNRQFTER